MCSPTFDAATPLGRTCGLCCHERHCFEMTLIVQLRPMNVCGQGDSGTGCKSQGQGARFWPFELQSTSTSSSRSFESDATGLPTSDRNVCVAAGCQRSSAPTRKCMHPTGRSLTSRAARPAMRSWRGSRTTCSENIGWNRPLEVSSAALYVTVGL